METFNTVMLTGTIILPIIAAAIYISHNDLSLWLGWLASVSRSRICLAQFRFSGGMQRRIPHKFRHPPLQVRAECLK